MILPHIPIQILAEDPAESLAFADILSGQGGAVTIAATDEAPLVMLVCPSGIIEKSGEIPALVLGERRDLPANARMLGVPVSVSDVLANIESLAQTSTDSSAQIVYAGWVLEPARMAITTPDGRILSLTDTEVRLMACLLGGKGTDISRATLLQRVWGYRPGLDTHTVETHIYRLRQKIENDPAHPAVLLTTEDGYRFAAPLG